MGQIEGDWPRMYATYLKKNLGYSGGIIEESTARLSRVRTTYREELDTMRGFVDQLKPKSPFKVYAGPIRVEQPEGYYCHWGG